MKRHALTLACLFSLLTTLPGHAETGTLFLCGGSEVFLIDTAAAEKGSFEKLWSWRAKDHDELPEALRSRFATTAECKPVEGGKKLLIASSSGGCALVERPSGRVLWHAQVTNAHSLELLPRERIVVASSLGNTGNKLVVYDLAQTEKPVFTAHLPSAHGVVWDEARQCLWALGFAELRSFELRDWDSTRPSLAPITTYPLPDQDGHDLQIVPGSSDLILSTHGHVYLFDRDKPSFRPHPELGDEALVKSVSIHPSTGRTAFIQASDKAWWSSRISLLKPEAAIEAGPERLYKARWLPEEAAKAAAP